MDDSVNVSVPTIKILQAAQAGCLVPPAPPGSRPVAVCEASAKVMKVPGAIESQEADSADAITALCLQYTQAVQ